MASIIDRELHKNIYVSWLIAVLFVLWSVWYFIRIEAVSSEEELNNGTLARGLVEGLAAPVWYYQYQPWGHGPLVEGFLLYPLFAVAGSSLLWIKVLTYGFAAAGFLIWTGLLLRVWGSGPALMFMLWWLIPSSFLNDDLHFGWANHMESVFFGGVILSAFMRAGIVPPARWKFALVGVWAGVACFFSMQNILFTAAAALAATWRWRIKGAERLAWPAGPAFLIGYLPHFLYVMARGWGANYFEPVTLSSVLERYSILSVLALPKIIGPPQINAASAGVSWLMWLCLPAAVLLWWRPPSADKPQIDAEGWLGRFLLLYLILFLAVYAATIFYVSKPTGVYNMRFLTPWLVAMMALTCGFLARIRKKIGWLLILPLLILNFTEMRIGKETANFFREIRLGKWAQNFTHVRGDDYYILVKINLPQYWRNEIGTSAAAGWNKKFLVAKRSIQRLPQPWKVMAYQELGKWLSHAETMALLRSNALSSEPWRQAVAYGAGQKAMFEIGDLDAEAPIDPRRWLDSLREWNDGNSELTEFYIRGLGNSLMSILSYDRRWINAQAADFTQNKMNPERNAGRGARVRHALEIGRAFSAALDRNQQYNLLFGAGQNMTAAKDGLIILALAGFAADRENETTYQQGFAAAEAWYYLRFYRHLPCACCNDNWHRMFYPEMAREALKGLGVSLRPLPRNPEFCALIY